MFRVIKFAKCECGAALVEYAVALVVVTIIGGLGVLALGQSTEALASDASAAVDAARSASKVVN